MVFTTTTTAQGMLFDQLTGDTVGYKVLHRKKEQEGQPRFRVSNECAEKKEETKLTVNQLVYQLVSWFYDERSGRKIVSSRFESEVLGNMHNADTKEEQTKMPLTVL